MTTFATSNATRTLGRLFVGGSSTASVLAMGRAWLERLSMTRGGSPATSASMFPALLNSSVTHARRFRCFASSS